MTLGSTRLTITPRSALVALGVVVVVVVWLFAFYFPQTHKLAALGTQRTTLQSTVAADQAQLQRAEREDHHIAQIQAMYDRLEGYVPTTENLYTYIRTINGAAKATGVTITSLSPGGLTPASGTSYSAIPVTASVKGTYHHLVAFLERLYDLPRLTDVNSFDITSGGPGTTTGKVLSASFQLAIFTSQTPATP